MVLVLLWASCGVVGYVIGRAKGRGALGAVLGVFLGVIGVVIIAWLSPAPGHGAHERSGHTRVGHARSLARPLRSSWSPLGRWAPDPHGRHRARWWDGGGWTDQVSDGAATFRDPLGSAPTPPAPPVAGWPGP
jgi:hypothetical protein